ETVGVVIDTPLQAPALAPESPPPAPEAPAPRQLPAATLVPCSDYGHGPDYSWISGDVQKWRKEWRLRYAPLDESDEYGGCLTLLGEQCLGHLREGQHCKLLGRVVPDDTKSGGLAYHIEAIQSVGR